MKASRKAASYVNLGRAYLRCQQVVRGREALARALELEPRWFLPRLLLARSHGNGAEGREGRLRAVDLLLDGPPSRRWRGEGLAELLRLYVELEDRRGLEALRGRRLPRALHRRVDLALGRLLAEEGRFSEALELFEPLAADGDAEAGLGLGDVLSLLEREEEALEAYVGSTRGGLPLSRIVECWERGGRKRQLDHPILVALVEGLLSAGRDREAESLLIAAARREEARVGRFDPGARLVEIYRLLARSFLVRNATAFAVEACHRILELDAGDREGLRLLVDAYERQWRFDRALVHCERLSLLEPSGALFHRLATLYVRTGSLRAAVGALNRARRHGLAVEPLALEIYDRLCAREEPRWVEDFDEAGLTTLARALLERSPQRSETLARCALFRSADALEPRLLLGRSLVAQGRLAEAVREFRMALRLHGTEDVRPHIELARLLEARGDGEGAVESCRRGLLHHGGSARLHFLHAELLIRRGLQVEALSALNLACRLDPDHDFRSLERDRQVSATTIVSMFEILLGIPPTADELLAEGRSLIERRRYDEAEPILRRARRLIEAEPLFSLRQYGMILLCLGTCLCNGGGGEGRDLRLHEALDLLREATRTRPDDPRPLVLLAEVYQRLGLHARAKEALDAAGRSRRGDRSEDGS